MRKLNRDIDKQLIFNELKNFKIDNIVDDCLFLKMDSGDFTINKKELVLIKRFKFHKLIAKAFDLSSHNMKGVELYCSCIDINGDEKPKNLNLYCDLLKLHGPMQGENNHVKAVFTKTVDKIYPLSFVDTEFLEIPYEKCNLPKKLTISSLKNYLIHTKLFNGDNISNKLPNVFINYPSWGDASPVLCRKEHQALFQNNKFIEEEGWLLGHINHGKMYHYLDTKLFKTNTDMLDESGLERLLTLKPV